MLSYQKKKLLESFQSFDFKDIYPEFDKSIALTAAELHKAFIEKELKVFFQPIVSLKNRQLYKFEALIRWQHPKYGFVLPENFLELAEKMGYDIPLGHFVIQQAFHHHKKWAEHGFTNIQISVNLSDNQFFDESLLGILEQISQNYDISFLSLELQEDTLLKGHQKYLSSAKRLKAIGVKITLDDFGSGISAIKCLEEGTISTLKIDRPIIQSCSLNPQKGAFIQGMLKMAQTMQIQVVAEGVEKAEHLNFLKRNHCDEAQGYYFSPPLSSADTLEYISRQKLLGCYAY